jgi:hypothetical protein
VHALSRALLSANNKTASVSLAPIVGSGRWAPHRGGLTGEDRRSLDVAYPRGISDIPQLLAAIDSRLVELAAEITALETPGRRSTGRAPSAKAIARPRPRTHQSERNVSATPLTFIAPAALRSYGPNGPS